MRPVSPIRTIRPPDPPADTESLIHIGAPEGKLINILSVVCTATNTDAATRYVWATLRSDAVGPYLWKVSNRVAASIACDVTIAPGVSSNNLSGNTYDVNQIPIPQVPFENATLQISMPANTSYQLQDIAVTYQEVPIPA